MNLFKKLIQQAVRPVVDELVEKRLEEKVEERLMVIRRQVEELDLLASQILILVQTNARIRGSDDSDAHRSVRMLN